MRQFRTVLCGLAVAAAAAPAAADPVVRKTEVSYAGGAVAGVTACQDTCRLLIEVRAGERFLHIGTSAPAGVVALDVTTTGGAVRVCHDTSAGPLPVDGKPSVKLRTVLDDPACGGPAGAAATGTITAYFADAAVPYADAVATSVPDPGRRAYGGL